MKNFSKLLGFGVLAFGISMSSCQKEEISQDNKSTTQPQEYEVTLSQENGTPIPGQYIVVFKSNTGIAKKAAASRDYSTAQKVMATEVKQFLKTNQLEDVELKNVYSSSVHGFAAKISEKALKQLKINPDVDFIEQDQVVAHNLPMAEGEVGIAAQNVPYGITRVGGGETYQGSNVAWVIDSGIDLDHPDLNVDASRGFTAFSSGSDANFDDRNGHGTHCAGTIAAIDNGNGVIGVAAGATVIPVKVLSGGGTGPNSGVVAGIDHVTANAKRGDVANMSLGGGASRATDRAVTRLANKGVKVAVAAGNSGRPARNYSPARVNHSNVLTISGCDVNDYWYRSSNYGNPPVDYCAPGVRVYSTYRNGRYATLTGTSMATPHVAGLLLLGNGRIRTDGFVSGDRDNNPDPIAHRY